MGLFGQSSPFDTDIDKATSEKNTTEPWDLIMNICDKVSSNSKNSKECLKSIMRRMGNTDPHVAVQAITLLDACVNNCGKNFHLEVASRDFENEFRRLLLKSQQPVASKMRLLLKKWAENDFKADPQLNLIPSLYQKLKSEGHDFSENQKAAKSAAAAAAAAAAAKDPNVVSSQQEEDDIAKAIELSLKETKGSPKMQQTSGNTYSSIYPSFTGTNTAERNPNLGAAVTNTPPVEPRKVRALYDFEAAEENELTFTAGEIIHVLDDTDPNWWKGYNQKGEGLFPSNFVTADLSVEPERIEINQKSKKTVQFENDIKQGEKTDYDNNKLDDDKPYIPEINEDKVDRLLHLLHEANPEDPSQDSDEMLKLEKQVNKMGPLIDAELERVDRKHAQLTQLSSDLVDAINLYHTLMRECDRSGMPTHIPIGGPISYMGNFNSTAAGVYGPNQVYNMPSLYPQAGQNTASPNTLSSLPIMGHLVGSANPAASNPQITVLGGSGPTTFAPHSQQMIPLRMQNGHSPAPTQVQLQSQMTQHQSQMPQHQSQMPQHQIPIQQHHIQQPTTQQQSMSQHVQNMVLSNSQITPQQQPASLQQIGPQPLANSQPNTFLPPNSISPYPSQQQNFANVPLSLAQVSFPYSSQSSVIPNGPGNNLMGQVPNSMRVSNPNTLPHPQHIAVINQPVTQTILGQSDAKNNIPVYQQQR